MGRSWALAAAALAVWTFAFGWYFVGTARLGRWWAALLRAAARRGPTP